MSSQANRIHRRAVHRPAVLLTSCALVSMLINSQLWAQKKVKIPGPENVTLRTKDGVALHCVYYGGTRGKETAPIVLLHDWDGQAADCAALALELQKTYGFAAMVPDLRGHGRSTSRTAPGRPTGISIDRKRMGARDIRAMVTFDLESIKKYLLAQHNQGNLNIELLSVVGAGMGAVVAVNWVALDWSWPELPTYKQGQDVKTFVLISPPTTFRGIKVQPAIARGHAAVRSKLAAMIVHGKGDAKVSRSASTIYKLLTRNRGDLQNVTLMSVDSSAQGTDLVTARRASVNAQIGRFLNHYLEEQKSRYPWTNRINPLSN